MRRILLGLTTFALAAGTAVTAPPASAVDVTGCAATQVNYGVSSCVYVALSTHGVLTLSVIDGVGFAEVYCSSGGYGSRASDGTSRYAQLPGDICTLYVYVDSTLGEAFAHAGSTIP